MPAAVHSDVVAGNDDIALASADLSTNSAYLKSLSRLFHNDGKLMAHVLIDSTDGAFTDRDKLVPAAQYIVERLSAMTPSEDFKTIHDQLRTTFNMVAHPNSIEATIRQIGAGTAMSPYQAFSFYASSAFRSLHDAVQAARTNGVERQNDPFFAASQNENGEANDSDSSGKYGLSGPLDVPAAASMDGLDFGGFFDAVGAKRVSR